MQKVQKSNALDSLTRYCCWLAVLGLLLMGTFAKRGWMDWRRIVRQKAHLEKQILIAQTEKELLRKKIVETKRSKSAQERLVRQTLGYVRVGESVIELD